MRAVFGSLVFAALAPVGGIRSCASAPAELVVDVTGAHGQAVADADLRWACVSAVHLDHVEPESSPALPASRTVAVSEPCELVVFQRAGMLWARSSRATVSPGDAAADVSFALDRPGGVGISFVRDPYREGMAITRVADDTPADDVGLRRGDVVLEVDGARADRARWPFSEQVMGEAGTEVTLTVASQGEPSRQITLIRRDLY